MSLELKQVSRSCFAVLNPKNRLCDANSGLINRGGAVVIDTQSDLPHASRMIELFSSVWSGMPRQVVNTHEDADHVWGNQLFSDAEIIAHRSAPDRMREVADPSEPQRLVSAAGNPLARLIMGLTKPALLALALQLREDYDFSGITLTLPKSLFDDQMTLSLEDTDVHLLHVGPGHQAADTIVHVPDEGVLFAGDVVFRECTPIGWSGRIDDWLGSLNRVLEINPAVIVPGHGPVCDCGAVRELIDYLEYVRSEARSHFEQGVTAIEAAKRIEFGPFDQPEDVVNRLASLELQ